MAEKLFLDTSFIIALVNQRDQYYQEVSKLSHQLENNLLITTEAIVLEIGNGLEKQYKKEAAMIIDVLYQAPNIEVVSLHSILDEGLIFYKNYCDKKWGLVDYLSFITMQKNGINKVLSFDAGFSQAGFILINKGG